MTGATMAGDTNSSDTAFQAYAEQLLRFYGEFHGQLLEDGLQKPFTIMETASSVLMPRWRR